MELPVALCLGAGLLVRAGGTIVTLVIGNLALKAALALSLADIFCPELLSGLAGVFVVLCVVCHVLPQGHVALVFFRLAALVILGLDVAFSIRVFKVCICFFAFVTGVCGHVLVFQPLVFHLFQQRNQRQLVAAL